MNTDVDSFQFPASSVQLFGGAAEIIPPKVLTTRVKADGWKLAAGS
jgi:hypothetical protein